MRIVDDGGQELIVYNDYDELGQLAHKKVGGTSASDYATAQGLQEVDYKYNVRSWLTSINNGVATGGDLFGFKLNYNTAEHGGTPLFNGNIAETSWATTSTNNTSNPVSTNYRYLYDSMNRILSATDNTGNYKVSGITYDKMGNIMSLTRNGHRDVNATTFGLMDDLTYQYTGNQLKAVDDAAAASSLTGFIDGAENATEYQFDANANMVRDDNKGITSITYNDLNLPEQVNLGTDDIQYVYSAEGIKLKKTLSNGTAIEYSGGHVYENGNLKHFYHPEGYVAPKNVNDYSQGFDYVYNYTDHLGSVRLSYTDADGNGSIDPANEIIEENNFYPFGLKQKGYNVMVNGVANKY